MTTKTRDELDPWPEGEICAVIAAVNRLVWMTKQPACVFDLENPEIVGCLKRNALDVAEAADNLEKTLRGEGRKPDSGEPEPAIIRFER